MVEIKEKKNIDNKISKKTTKLSPRHILKENDEGSHNNSIFILQEWWYYNTIFNNEKSELKNWFFMISSTISPRTNGFRIQLIDKNNKCYGGTTVYRRNPYQSIGPGVNISYENWFMKGKYPNWHIYVEYSKSEDLNLTVDLNYKANSLPMWIVKNTGNNRSNSLFGYYALVNCKVHGTISINSNNYNVSGQGYHDHTWAPFKFKKHQKSNHGLNKKSYNKKRKKTKKFDLFNSWDWLNIHFDNGWEMFVGKIYFGKRFLQSKFGPGSICFTSSGKELYECLFFVLDYVETKDTTLKNVKIPKIVHIKGSILNIFGNKQLKGPILLDFYFEVEKTQEYIGRNPPYQGLWQSQGKIQGFAKSSGKKIQLNGWANMEYQKRN